MIENKQEFKNKLFINDNIIILNGLNSNLVDLVYLDPPFNSKRVYNAALGSYAEGSSFKDTWKWEDIDEFKLDAIASYSEDLAIFIKTISKISDESMMAYITYMAQRVIQLHRILKPTGSLYYHCDPTAGHFVKLMLDCIFGRKNFRNEIVWCYKSGGASKRHFSRKHDLIYFYSKSDNYFFNFQKEKSYGESGGGQGGKVVYYKDENGTYSMVGLKDWWPISMLSTTHPERTGYPTQKPLALLDRIIKSSCPENGIVLDPFCGCATTCVSAEHLGRHWIGIDIEDQAMDILIARLTDGQIGAGRGLQQNFDIFKEPLQRTDVEIKNLKEPQTYKEIKQFLFEKQNHKCLGCGKEKYIEDFDIDHIIPKSHGGGDYMENYQLLCRHCNIMKGNKPMEFLLQRIEYIESIKQYNFYNK